MKFPSKIKALIFDFDGLLVNTEELIRISYSLFLKRKGHKIDHSLYLEMLGRSGLVNMKLLKEKYGLEGDPEDLLEERREISRPLFENRIALMDGVHKLLGRVKNWKVKCAIASGGRKEFIEATLKRFGILEQFSVIITVEDLLKSIGKPDPEVFLIAAQRLEVDPVQCLVLEDSPNGIESAKAAGMKVIYIPDAKYVDTYHEKADGILKSLHELTDEIIYKLAH